MGAPEFAQQYWGRIRAPAERAAEEQFVAEAGLGAETARAGVPLAPRRAELGLRGIEQPLDIEQQRAEQERAMGAPTLEAASIANQLAQQRMEEERLTAPIMREQLEAGPPLTEAEALGALPEQLRVAPAMERLGMEGAGAPAVADVRRQQALGRAGNIMAMTGLDQMIGLVSPEQDIMAEIGGDILQPSARTVDNMKNLVATLKAALGQATPEEAEYIKGRTRANLNYADVINWTRKGPGMHFLFRGRHRDMQNMAQELQGLVEGM